MTHDNTRPTTTKRCSRCQEPLPVDQFGKDPARKDGLKTRCRGCRNTWERERRHRERQGLPPRSEVPAAPTVCVSCDEGEHDTCLRILRPGACICTCPTEDTLEQLPMPTATFLVCGMEVQRKIARASAPPWPEADYCHSGHLIEGDNAYWDAWQRRWLCRRCRRASWARSERRKRATYTAANTATEGHRIEVSIPTDGRNDGDDGYLYEGVRDLERQEFET